MKAVIKPSELSGSVKAPPSKSYAHRMLIAAALTDGVSRIHGISESEDMKATLDCIRALGAAYETENEDVIIRGVFSKAKRPEKELPVFSCRESGSTLRFFIPIALTLCQGGTFTGTERLIERGIGVYEELFHNCGIVVDKSKSCISLSGKIPSGTYQIRGDISSQFITGMLFAMALQKESSTIEVLPPVESRAYIDITIDVLKQFGISVTEEKENVFVVRGGQTFRPGNFTVEGDWSNAAFLYAFNAVGGTLDIQGLKTDSVQGDKLCVPFFDQLVGRWPGGTDPENAGLTIDISNTPDLGPVLFAAAAALRGGSFTGTRRLRIKESDRAQAMAEELEKFGAQCLVGENDVVVLQSVLKKPAVPLNGHNDHRIVMALSVLAALTGGEIEGAEAVSKSWPDFFSVMKQAGLDVEISNY